MGLGLRVPLSDELACGGDRTTCSRGRVRLGCGAHVLMLCARAQRPTEARVKFSKGQGSEGCLQCRKSKFSLSWAKQGLEIMSSALSDTLLMQGWRHLALRIGSLHSHQKEQLHTQKASLYISRDRAGNLCS